MSLRLLAVGALVAGALLGALDCARGQGPATPPEPAATSARPQSFRLTSGLYRFTTRGSRGVERGEIKLVCKGGAVRVIDIDDTKWPGEGRVDGNEFTLLAADEHGEVRMSGSLLGNDALEGTITLVPVDGRPAEEMDFTLEKTGPVTAPWSREQSRPAKL